VAPAAGAGAVARSGEVARAGEVGGIVATESEASALIVLSAPVDGVIELYVFPAGDTPEDATSSAAVAVRAYEYVDVPGGSGAPLGAAAVDGVEPTWDSERWRGWLEGLVTD
ncbi:SRPBCC domain-containing protein, partial [Dietzia natronolimnaea]|nr:SRPBCC domain-containing protein [Dietzia natronolimnaea]